MNRKLFLSLALIWAVAQGALSQSAATGMGFGDMPEKVSWRDAQITDVGVVVSQIAVTVSADSVTGQRDTTYTVYPNEVVWQSEGTDVFDSVAVTSAARARNKIRKAPTQGPVSQSGNLMEDFLNSFQYYVFSFNYPSIDADGNQIMLSGMAACPAKAGTSQVNNVVIGTHITITADRERPSSHFSNYDADDWGLLLSMAGGPKMLLNSKVQKYIGIGTGASCVLSLIVPFAAPIISVAQAIVGIAEIGQLAKAKGYHDYDYNLVIMPDYEGYGLTKDRAHPYLYQELTARQCIDATRYGIALYNSDPALQYIRVPIRKNFRSFSCGYSQGGSVAMACHRFVEQNHLNKELHFVGSICGDGPYDPISTLMYYVGQEKSGKYLSMPVVLPLIVKGMLDTNPYMKSHKAEDYFNPKFLETGIMDWLASKEKSTFDIEGEFKKLYEKGKNGDVNYYRDIFVKSSFPVRENKQQTAYMARLSGLMNEACYEYFSKLYEQHKSSFTSAKGIPLPQQRGVMEDLHFALASNDMTSGWVPQYGIIMFHSKGDTVVPYVNAEKAFNSLDGKVDLEVAPNGLDHGDSGLDFFKGDDLKDLALRFLNLRLFDNVSSICGRNY